MNRPRKVVCAANKHNETGIVVLGARHFDDWMTQQVLRLINSYGEFHDFSPKQWECGFIDNQNNFLTREEAYHLALVSGQIVCESDEDLFFPDTPGKVLISEDLY